MEEMWNQHKNLIGYFGTPEAPVSVSLRGLHDGWDFCSFFMATVQEKGKALSTIGVVTDRADTHCNLDMVKCATISAEDLRISFQLDGAVDSLTVTEKDGGFLVAGDGIRLMLRFPYVEIRNFAPMMAIERDQGMLTVSLILYHGNRRDVCLCGLDMGIVTTLEMLADGESPAAAPVCLLDGGVLTAEFDGLSITAPIAALPEDERMMQIKLYKNGEPYRPAK